MEVEWNGGLPMWNMSQTCFQMYGTKRKTTFSGEEEPQNQFCSVAKKACVSSSEMPAMEEGNTLGAIATAQPAITHQPSHAPQDITVHQTHHHTNQEHNPNSHNHHQQHHHQHHQEQQQSGKGANNWAAWRRGQKIDWKASVHPQQQAANAGMGETMNARMDNCHNAISANNILGACGGGGDGERVGSMMEGGEGPRVEIDCNGDGDWQSPENLREQLEKQVHTPDLEQTRQETLRAKVQKLKKQLQFINSNEIQSNDYWALPQENCLRMEDELEQARMSMETDYVPDPAQYHCIDRPVPMAGHDSGVVSQVRCYCKPNWEGMADPVAYI